MYYQVFFKKSLVSKLSQVSCDNWEEVINELERLGRPKLVIIEHHNCSGLVGISKKFYNSVKEVYFTYKKIKINVG